MTFQPKVINSIPYLILLLTMSAAQSQDISSHKWNDRIVLLLTEDVSNETYQKQVAELKTEEQGLKERKLIVYHLQPDSSKKGLSANQWEKASTLFETYKKTNSGFEFVLIGLDGGIKLQQTEFITSKELFSIIDVMPMRRSEMIKDN